MYKLGLIGSGIKSSLSPKLHYNLAKKYNKSISYSLIDIELNEFDTIFDVIRNTFLGINVTSPFKEIAASKCISTEKSVNTILFNEDKIIGSSTDGAGFLSDLKEKNISIKEKDILLIGLGGAAKAIIPYLSTAKSISLINRTQKKVDDILKTLPPNFNNKLKKNYDLIIQTTSHNLIPLEDELNFLNLRNSFFYDINYGKKSEAIFNWLKDKRVFNYSNGEGMLKKQAELSFFTWFKNHK